MNADGMTIKEITRCQLQNKCPLCSNTTPQHTWIKPPRPVPPMPPTVLKNLSDVKHRRKLYKKLRARTKSNGMTYDGHENDDPTMYEEDELDIEAADDGEEEAAGADEVEEELSDDLVAEDNEYMDVVGDPEIATTEAGEAMDEDDEEKNECDEVDACKDSESNVERWIKPCCIVCGINASGKFCRECSNYIRKQARSLLFYK